MLFYKTISSGWNSLKIKKILHFKNHQNIKITSVYLLPGCQEILQLKKLQTKFPKISATVVEPSAEGISKYQEMVQQNSHDFTGITFEWHQQTFQEFMRSKSVGKKYHFISVVQTFYYLGDVEEAVQNLYDLLLPGGMMYVVLESGKLNSTVNCLLLFFSSLSLNSLL